MTTGAGTPATGGKAPGAGRPGWVQPSGFPPPGTPPGGMPPPAVPPRMPPPDGVRAQRAVLPRAIVAAVLAVLGVVGFFGLTMYVERNDGDHARPGDCTAKTGPDKVERVACTDPTADFRVLGVTRGPEPQGPRDRQCDRWSQTTDYWWYGVEGRNGVLLCMVELGR